jgi:hypothetical protein
MEINMRTFFIALAILLTGFCLFYGCRFNLETMNNIDMNNAGTIGTNNYLNNGANNGSNNAMIVNNNSNNNSNNNANYVNKANNSLTGGGVEGMTSNNLNTGVY